MHMKFHEKVLDAMKENVGRYKAETGGMIGCWEGSRDIDHFYFDMHSQNTPGTFYYDVETMTSIYGKWKKKNVKMVGIVHSHPKGVIEPSFHDITSAYIHIKFLNTSYFYLPIVQPKKDGTYDLYMYKIELTGQKVIMESCYHLKVFKSRNIYIEDKVPNRIFSVWEIENYIKNKDKSKGEGIDKNSNKNSNNEKEKNQRINNKKIFEKIKDLYPESGLQKVIVTIGVGGARSCLENLARCGFKNFVLIDADTVSESNIATQAVYVSEIGRRKVEVLRERILDINPEAKVIAVSEFLDDTMTDERFQFYLKQFGEKTATEYLIMGCTDNFYAQKRSALLALKFGIPYMAAMLYKNGAAAEIIFTYPGVTPACPRCLLRSRFEKYENGFENDVNSSSVPIFATERMNSLKGYIALMLLLYRTEETCLFTHMLDHVKDRNFVQIRLNPNVNTILGIGIFNKVFQEAERYTYMDETVWIPQSPDNGDHGEEICKLCHGTGNLDDLYGKWKDTRKNSIQS